MKKCKSIFHTLLPQFPVIKADFPSSLLLLPRLNAWTYFLGAQDPSHPVDQGRPLRCAYLVRTLTKGGHLSAGLR